MSILDWFSSSSKTVDNVMDKDNGLLAQVGGWIGGMNFTEEERAETNLKLADGISNFVKMTLQENTKRSKTRREIAVLWIKAQLIMIFWVMLIAPFDRELAKFYATIVFGTLMISGTLAVLAFFFGSHMLSSHLGFNKKPPK